MTFNVSAVVQRDQQASLTAGAIIKRVSIGSFTINAIRMPRFFANSVKLGTQLRSTTANAYFVGPLRTTHPRDNSAHYDLDLDSIITLSKTLGVYSQGVDLHTVLLDMWNRVTDIEGGS